MLKINPAKPDTVVLDAEKLEPPFRPIPGFWVRAKRVTVAMILAARTAAYRARQAAIEAAGIVLPQDPVEAGKVLVEHPEVQAAGEEAFTTSIAVAGIFEWGGVCGPDNNPLKPTPETVKAALGNPAVFDFIDRKYVIPALSQDDEKNASSPSRSTTSRRAKHTAKVAGKPPRTEPAPNAPTS
jgi:hypothetical protein